VTVAELAKITQREGGDALLGTLDTPPPFVVYLALFLLMKN
jgi:hypothetical protein